MANLSKLLAISLIALLLVSTVGPTMFSGEVTAQDDTPEEVADLLVFTAFEDRDGQPVKDRVYAVDPSTGNESWNTTLNNSNTTEAESAIAVAADDATNQVYALSIDPNSTLHIYAIDSASGDIIEAHETNISTSQLGRFAVADNSTVHFTTPETAYEFDFESDSLTKLYDHHYPPIDAYHLGLENNTLQLSAYSSDGGYAEIYDGTNNTDTINKDLHRIKYTDLGYIYQTTNDDLEFRTNGSTTWSEVLTEGTLRSATANETLVYAKIGDRIREYGTTANSDDTTIYTTPSYNNTSHRLSTLDYESGYIHDFETRQGNTNNITTDTPTVIYRMYDSNGTVVYSNEIAHSSNYHRSVAVVHDDGQSVIASGSDTDYTVEDILSEFLPSTEVLLGGLVLSVLLAIGLALIVKILKIPLKIILYPFMLIWRVSLWLFLLPFRIVSWLIDYYYPD